MASPGSGFNGGWMYGAETSLRFDQSVTSVGGERTDSMLVFLGVT